MLESSKLSAVFLDLDNNNRIDGSISDRTVKLLKAFCSQGVLVGFVTSRSSAIATIYINELNLSQDIIPVVCFNGALGVNYYGLSKLERLVEGEDSSVRLHKEVVFSFPLNEEHCGILLDLAEGNGCVAQFYNSELSGEIIQVNPAHYSNQSLLTSNSPMIETSSIQLSAFNAVLNYNFQFSKISIMTEKIDDLLCVVSQESQIKNLTIAKGSSPVNFYIDFMREGVSKIEGVRLLCESLKVPIDNLSCFKYDFYQGELFYVVGNKSVVREFKSESIETKRQKCILS